MTDLIYAYTRKQALEDGEQVDVSSTAIEAGFRFPVYLTRGVHDQYVAVPPDVHGQDESGRLWDILNMLRFAIRSNKGGSCLMEFSLHVRNDNRSPQLVTLVSECGPLDMDDPSPAITIMLPGGD